jgi:hypothetical protein
MNPRNPHQSTFFGQTVFVGMQPSPDWRRWIAENLLLRVPHQALLDAMLREGFDRDTATREIHAAENHPYLIAARGVNRGPDPAAATNVDAKIKKRDWILEIYRRTSRQASTFGQVPRVRKPSRQEFLDNYYSQNRPVVIEGALDDWPAMTRWTNEELKRRFGDRLVEVQANRNADPNYEVNCIQHKKEMRFGDYVDLIERAGATNDFYMTANNSGKNRENLKELWEDIILFPDYLRDDDPNNRGFFWFGPQGTVTPMHHDLTNNFMAQVRGRKHIKLIAPCELADVYNYRHCYTHIDLEQIDYARFPQFRNVKVIDLTIGPGDLFFLPVGWWHHVRGLDVSITMTFTNFVFDNDFYSFYTTYQDI